MMNLVVRCLPITSTSRQSEYTPSRTHGVGQLDRKSIFCQSAVSLHAFFRHDLPLRSSKQRFFQRIFSLFDIFRQSPMLSSISCTARIWTEPLWGSTFASLFVQPECTTSPDGVGSSRSIDLFLQSFPCGVPAVRAREDISSVVNGKMNLVLQDLPVMVSSTSFTCSRFPSASEKSVEKSSRLHSGKRHLFLVRTRTFQIDIWRDGATPAIWPG